MPPFHERERHMKGHTTRVLGTGLSATLLIGVPALLPAAADPGSLAPQAGTQASGPHFEMVVESRSPLEGVDADYERLTGHVLGEVDPDDPANAGIVNLHKAPVNDTGLVDYSVEFEIHKPVDAAQGNGTLLYEVVNRGNPLIPASVNGDDTLLYDEGFTLVWSGWQGDLPESETALNADFPVATDDGEPIIDLVRDEFVDQGTGTWTGTLSYPVASSAREEASLTVRQNESDPRQPMDDWRYVNEQQIEVTHPGAPFDSGAIFEFIYPGTEPTVLGLGLLSTRDINSFLRFAAEDSAGNPNPLDPGSIQNALALGISQSGRYLREYIYGGFNQDLEGRQIFDGAMPIIAGSRRIWLNYEFAQVGRWSKQHEEHLQRGDQFPFTYPTFEDPLTGEVDGILAACSTTATCPKIMHVDGEYEVWGARGSLVVTDGNPEGPQDVDMPDDVRVYMVAGTPHGGDNTILPPTNDPGICQQVNTPLGTRVVIRSLLLRLDDWTADGVKPPRSNYGSADRGTLVDSARTSTRFPEIPGVTYNGLYNYLRVTDYSATPPAEGAEYDVLVPRVDNDGNSRAGIRLPALEAPLATYAGWNLRAAGHAEGEMCGSAGSFIPFAATREERIDEGDPRRSVAERYHTSDRYVERFSNWAHSLVRKGYLLPVDAQSMIEEAEAISID